MTSLFSSLSTQARSHKKALTGAVIFASAAGMSAMIIPRAGEIAKNISHVQAWVFVVTFVLGMMSLLLRGEVWRTCLGACAGKHSERRQLHAANSFGMLGNSLNHYVGPAMRISLLRQLDGETAPKPCQMLAADAPVILTEAGIAVLLFAAAVGAAGLPWWLPVAAGASVVTAIGGLWMARRRFAHVPTARGLSVLTQARSRKRMLTLITLAVGLQVARTFLLLHAVGLHPQFWQVAMTFCATGVLGILPLGPATSSGATFAVFGATSATAAAAAGVIMTALAFSTALVYALWGASVIIRRLGRERWQHQPQSQLQVS
jgi:hypothetical protein